MTWSWLVLASCLLLLPTVAACTTSEGPHRAVHLVVTQGERTILEMATDITVGPNSYCSQDVAPPLFFDGRFLAWSRPGPQGFHVVDLLAGGETTYPDAALTSGHLAVLPLDGARASVTLVDLANRTSRQVDLPQGYGFMRNSPGAVVAEALRGYGNASTFSLLDPVTGRWILQDALIPKDRYDVPIASHDWVLFSAANQPVNAVAVATGAVSTVADSVGHALALQGDRLFLLDPGTAGSAGPYGTQPSWWSVRLPYGTDRQEGPPAAAVTVGNRTAVFRVADTTTSPGSPGNSGSASGTAPPAITPAAGLGAGTKPASVLMGASVLLLVAGAAWLRRRL